MAAAQLIEDKIFSGKYVASLNKLYHHTMTWRFGVIDRAIRVAVGVLAIGSFTASLLTGPSAPLAISTYQALLLSFGSMTAAIVLNVVPVNDFYRRYNESYRSWTTHFARWENVENRYFASDAPDTTEFLREINELTAERNNIESSETAGWRGLLQKCQAEVNAMFFGEKNPSNIRKLNLDSQPQASEQDDPPSN